MKKNLLFSALFLLTLISCRKDDDTLSIVGTWKYTKDVIYDGKDGKILSTEIASTCNGKEDITFNSDGTYVLKNFGTDASGTCIEGIPSTGKYTYDYAGKKITISYSTNSGTVTNTSEVTAHTNTELNVVTDTYDYNKDGVDDKQISYYIK